MSNSERARKTAEKIGHCTYYAESAVEEFILSALNEAVKEKEADLDTANKRIAELEAKDPITDDDLVRIMNKVGSIKTQYGKFVGDDVQMWANIRSALGWELMPSRRAKEEQTDER